MFMKARDLPYQHLSIRVPWHDTGWEGTVCKDPIGNSSCLRLKQIAKSRDDATELRLAGKTWKQIRPEEIPPCADERAGFMSTNSRDIPKEHPYASLNEAYSKFSKVTYELPAYAADCIPFRWMLRKEAAEIAKRYSLDYSDELEEGVDEEANYSPIWVQHAENQTLLLDTFFSSVEPERSLVFFYAQESPLSDDPRRLLIGVGRARSVGNVVPYKQTADGFGSVIWQRVIKHSIRPSMEDGFILPYHELLYKSANDDRDLADFAVFVPDEYRFQFSYASEHVSHDAALALLLSMDRAIERFAPLVDGNWDGPRSWLSDRLAEVWQARGPCPGLGAALVAFGIKRGVLLAYAAQSEIGDNEDPWPLVDQWIRDPSSVSEESLRVDKTRSEIWSELLEERRSLLKLLSRFDLSPEQATRIYQETERKKAGISLSDKEILSNPYLIYEANRLTAEPVAISIIDRGVFPTDQIRSIHPLPEPSAVEGTIDPRRVRALMVDVLEEAADAGHSLQSQNSVIQEIRDRPLDPTCPLSVDAMSVCAKALPPAVVTVQMAKGEPAYQLQRLNQAKRAISRQIGRRRGVTLPVVANWRAVIDDVLDEQLGEASMTDDDDEELARQEKAAALEILATSRVSVLIGAAGTGKTTLLRALTRLPDVSKGGLLLLAPTGKARVQMQTAIDRKAFTLAQFLLPQGRYDSKTGRYKRSNHDRWKRARTVIVDECSMLTEEMLDALLDSIEGYERLVLVGDPRQLPPIGTGRPFVDIIEHFKRENSPVRFPLVAASYAELTIPRRQIASGSSERADLLMAEWFSGNKPSPASDEVWDLLGSKKDLDTISVRQWSDFNDLHEMLREEIARQSHTMANSADSAGFEKSYGGQVSGDYVKFSPESAADVEAWQVLSPIRGDGSGINELNRMLQRVYRSSTLQRARNLRYNRSISKPGGIQEIVYGDKVMNVRNEKRKNYYTKNDGCLEYVANGEIGFITGPLGRKNRYLDKVVNVAFSTQVGTAYTYKMSELGGDDKTPVLELAYAITIHKSQGSEFKRTFVVMPNPCRPLSRELLYTALTRQREHVVILHQGDLFDLRELSNPARSETAARQTNLFSDPTPVEINGRFLEAGLIHRTRNGLAVRSKSEVVIADLLYSKGIEFQYELPFRGDDGSWRSPDFTIEDDTTGTTFYWEHLGMLQRSSYRQKWEQKLAWYREHGVLPHEEGGGPAGVLIVTKDGDDGSISSAEIEALIDELLE